MNKLEIICSMQIRENLISKDKKKKKLLRITDIDIRYLNKKGNYKVQNINQC
jgi:DNA-directed RNA polymerase